MKRYKWGVIGTWTLCDCDEPACKRMPVKHNGGKKQMPAPKVKRERRRAAWYRHRRREHGVRADK